MQAPVGVQRASHTEQVALVGAASVVQDQQALGVAGRGTLFVDEVGHAGQNLAGG